MVYGGVVPDWRSLPTTPTFIQRPMGSANSTTTRHQLPAVRQSSLLNKTPDLHSYGMIHLLSGSRRHRWYTLWSSAQMAVLRATPVMKASGRAPAVRRSVVSSAGRTMSGSSDSGASPAPASTLECRSPWVIRMLRQYNSNRRNCVFAHGHAITVVAKFSVAIFEDVEHTFSATARMHISQATDSLASTFTYCRPPNAAGRY